MPGVPFPSPISEAVVLRLLKPTAIVAPESQMSQVDGVLRVKWVRQTYDIVRRRAKFVDGVEATYGPTQIFADELELDYESKQGWARGKVRLVDPEGSLEAENLTFNWNDRTGFAEGAFIRVGDIRGSVSKVEIQPTKWVFDNIYASASPRKTPDIAFRSPRVEVSPGRRGRARRPDLILFGRKIITLPTTSFTLDRRVEGLRIPSLSFRQKEGFGINWSSGVLVNENSALSATFAAFPKNLPSYTISYSVSSVPPSASTGFIIPRNELGERFSTAYMERVDIRLPQTEDDDLRAPRRTFALQSGWNLASFARRTNETGISKPLEAVYELSQATGGWGVFAAARAQTIRAGSKNPFQVRSQATGTLQAPVIKIGRRLEARLRSDVQGIGGGQSNSAFVQGALSLVYQPTTNWRLGVGYLRAMEFGSASFAVDRLFTTHAYQLRVDGRIGGFEGSLLWKYDLQRRNWYDTEWMLTLPAGSFDLFVMARLFPRTNAFGLRLRAQSTLNRLADRNQVRMSQFQKKK